MDHTRFDILVQSLATPTAAGSRRRAVATLSGLLGLALGASSLQNTAAKKKKKKKKKKRKKTPVAVSPPPASVPPPPPPPPPPPCTCTGGTCTNGQCVCPATQYECADQGFCCATGVGCTSAGCTGCTRRNSCSTGFLAVQQCGPFTETIACGCVNSGTGTACVNIQQGDCATCTPEAACTIGGQPGVCVDLSGCSNPSQCVSTGGRACIPIGDCA